MAVGLTIGCSLLFASSALAAAPYVKGQVIVKYADSASQAQRLALADRFGLGRLLDTVNGTGARVVAVSLDPRLALS